LGNFTLEKFWELLRLENVALQQTEQHDMVSENHGDQRAEPKPETVKDLRSSTKPSAPSGPPILNDGPELLRSSHC
jgi:hypothetical protein